MIAVPGLWLPIALLAGCSDPVKHEHDRLKMMQKTECVEEVCEQSRKVAAAAQASRDG
jgi:hypothetical protein